VTRIQDKNAAPFASFFFGSRGHDGKFGRSPLERKARMKRLSLLVLALAFPLFAVGCASEDSPPIDSAVATPTEKCQALAKAFCDKFVVECKVADEGCQRESEKIFGCATATGVSGTYDTCLAEIKGATCAHVKMDDDPPASCQKVITSK
jgi:hypothetical protein